MNKVVHFEIPSDDKTRAKKFYSDTFGWKMKDYPMPGGVTYTGALSTPVDKTTQMPTEPGSINGAIVERSNDVPAPIITIGVDSVDEYIKKVEAAGGKAGLKGEVPNMGYFAYVKDTEGNTIGLWQDFQENL